MEPEPPVSLKKYFEGKEVIVKMDDKWRVTPFNYAEKRLLGISADKKCSLVLEVKQVIVKTK